MESSSPLANHLLDYLGEGPIIGRYANCTTVLRQGQLAQDWLLTTYLGAWLELLRGLVECRYPLAEARPVAFLAVSRLQQQLDPGLSATDQIFFLENTQTHIKLLAKNTGVASERSMQWGVWGRDIPIAIATGFIESDILNPVICEGIAPCCMYAAFVASQVVTDDGVAEEIGAKMFEEMPRALLDIIQRTPAAPEA